MQVGSFELSRPFLNGLGPRDNYTCEVMHKIYHESCLVTESSSSLYNVLYIYSCNIMSIFLSEM